ncbi:hypothetical protein [Methylosinus sp. PW1]|uniref:hypothetical protein n=1 Tax=Methylosinus sp. PW1 TaxID=107636 RepID=UPI000AA17767|nr:hypothetical protein [Methylosinus sp. PW1]
MSVFKRQGQTVYSYDFQLAGRRFTGGAGTANRREAKEIEAAAKAKAKADIEAERSAQGAPLTIASAAVRYFEEVGKHHAASNTTLKNLIRLQDYFGDGKRLDEITDDDIAQLVAWRRAQTVKGRRKIADPANKGKMIAAPLVSPATVNRSTVEVLQKLFNRARNFWSRSFPREPKWSQHLLPETSERVREVRTGEEGALEEAIRADLSPSRRIRPRLRPAHGRVPAPQD